MQSEWGLCLGSRPPVGSTLVAQVTFTPGEPRFLRQITMTPGRFSCGSGSGYTHINGSEANRRIHSSGACGVAGLGGPRPSCSLAASATTGCGPFVIGNPNPMVQVN